ncbi:hypothetical protein VaNZ11_012390 [Volvox africanus]|uniref:Uncharacterized protein n=1 Tax=Volvox africanus TaxID=51714 RepID=A0ABQ5SFE2_9CHLO|nr:hypothetical protein VaNZ11_012390 [Volvox africanus]
MDVLLGLRVKVPATEWGLQEGAFWGVIVQLGIDTSGSSCVGIQFDGRDLFHWPTDMVIEWLADSILMFKRPRLGAPDKTILRPTASQREPAPWMGAENVLRHASEHNTGQRCKGIPPDDPRASPPAALGLVHTSNTSIGTADAERERDCSGIVDPIGQVPNDGVECGAASDEVRIGRAFEPTAQESLRTCSRSTSSNSSGGICAAGRGLMADASSSSLQGPASEDLSADRLEVESAGAADMISDAGDMPGSARGDAGCGARGQAVGCPARNKQRRDYHSVGVELIERLTAQHSAGSSGIVPWTAANQDIQDPRVADQSCEGHDLMQESAPQVPAALERCQMSPRLAPSALMERSRTQLLQVMPPSAQLPNPVNQLGRLSIKPERRSAGDGTKASLARIGNLPKNGMSALAAGFPLGYHMY